MAEKKQTIIILACFFASGFLGLVYEIIWIRRLGLIFGTTVFSITTVLSAFFGGLAIGSFVFGKFADHFKNPIKIYAILEFAVGIFALLFPSFLKLYGGFYNLIYEYVYQSFVLATAIKFILFVFLLIIPTIMMGGTLPILSKYFIRSNEVIGKRLGIIYGINTAGATLGVFLCGFYFMHLLGVDSTNYIAGGINIIIALFLYFVSRNIETPSPNIETSEKPKLSSRILWDSVWKNVQKSPFIPLFQRGKLNSTFEKLSPNSPFIKGGKGGFKNATFHYISVCFFLSGFASIGYEIAWTRYLSLPLANTRYTYTMILAIFLLGTALGSLIFARLFDRIKNRVRFFACLEIGIGTSAFLLSPIVYYFAIKIKYSLILYDFLACSILMFIPTLLMGATFPIVVRIMTKDYGSIGNWTGKLYAINTFGCILGSIVAGFVLIPLLGIKLSLGILIAINIVIGLFCLFRDSKKSWIFNSIIVSVTVIVFIIIHFSMKIDIPRDFLNIIKGKSEEIISIEEGLENTVWVTTNSQNQQKSIWANQTVLGRTLTNEPYTFSPQIIQGHIPMLLHRGSPKKILGICLGTGQTFGSILSYDIEKMDLVEISKTIANIASEEFRNYNRNLIGDKRVNLVISDGRDYVAHTKNTYDIITLEPSPPEEAGIVNLYTKEFYGFCYKRLNADGIMSQWLPIYSTHPDETARIIKTFISVFPNSLLWYNSADLILLGFKGDIKFGIDKIGILLANKVISDDLSISYLDSKDSYLKNQYPLLACLLMGPDELRDFSESYLPITDNHPDLEYTFLKYERLADKSEMMVIYNAEKIKQYLAPLKKYYTDNNIILDQVSFYDYFGVPKRQLSPAEANASALHTKTKNQLGQQAIVKTMESIRSRYIGRLFAEAYNRIATTKDNPTEAIALCKKALEYDPNYGMAYGNLGSYYYNQGDLAQGINYYKKAVELLPDLPYLWHVLGSVYWTSNSPENAINAWLNAVKHRPKFAEAYNDLGVVYTNLGRYQEAIISYKGAIMAKADYADAYYNLGLAYEAISDWQNAISAYKKALEIDPKLSEADVRLKNMAN